MSKILELRSKRKALWEQTKAFLPEAVKCLQMKAGA